MIHGVNVAMETHDDQEKVLDWAWKFHTNWERQFIVKTRAQKGGKEGEDHTKGLLMKGFGLIFLYATMMCTMKTD